MRDAREVRFFGAGQNWLPLSGCIAVGLSGYYSPLPAGSSVSVTSQEPGSAIFNGPALVGAGTFDMGITTPSWVARLAVNGQQPFRKPIALRALATFAHDDRLVFAVRRETGVKSLSQVAEDKVPLRISTPLRETRHAGVWCAERVAELHGFTFDDITAWGGEILRDRPKIVDVRPGMVAINPAFTAIFDEAIMTRRWPAIAREYDLRYLAIEDGPRETLKEWGWPVGVIEAGRLPGVDRDVAAVDFSGWILYCREDLDDELAYLTIQAIDEQQFSINEWFSTPTMGMTSPVDMNRLGRDPAIPLHAGAERYYQEKGYLA
jgi:hypothetical protein